MVKVLLDTNFLIYLLEEKKFNLFEEFLERNVGKYKIYIFEGTLAEIGSRNRFFLKMVKLLLKNKKLDIIKEKGRVDDLILKHKNEFIVATNDKKLLEKLEKKITKTKKYFLAEI